MTSTTEPAVYVTSAEYQAMGGKVEEGVDIFLGVPEAVLLLVDMAANFARVGDACQDCEGCEALASLWWQVYMALPSTAMLSLLDLQLQTGITPPPHPVHNPR